MTGRSLPVLDMVRPEERPAPVADARVAEFVTDDVALPSFHVWTLGCQMNRSDSEEMAGSLLAAGCAPASSLESAGLIVINSCAIREAAEQKVIGRQGHLANLKRANPGLRVVLTGCSVREAEREKEALAKEAAREKESAAKEQADSLSLIEQARTERRAGNPWVQRQRSDPIDVAVHRVLEER